MQQNRFQLAAHVSHTPSCCPPPVALWTHTLPQQKGLLHVTQVKMIYLIPLNPPLGIPTATNLQSPPPPLSFAGAVIPSADSKRVESGSYRGRRCSQQASWEARGRPCRLGIDSSCPGRCGVETPGVGTDNLSSRLRVHQQAVCSGEILLG